MYRTHSLSRRIKSTCAALTTTALSLVAATSFAAACETSYTARDGDTLPSIAREQLGSIFAFNRLFEANEIPVARMSALLHPGQHVALPCGPTGPMNLDVVPTAATLDFLLHSGPIQLLDIRSSEAVADGVISGSVSSPYAHWIGQNGNPAFVPTDVELSAVISRAGLDLSEPTVIIHGGGENEGLGQAARVYWLLKSAGASDVAILRDGFAGWQAAGRPIAAKAELPEPSAVTVSSTRRWRADTLDVIGIATLQSQGHLLDVRPHEQFNQVSHNGSAISTTLPRAQHGPVDALIGAQTGELAVEDAAEQIVSFLKKNEMLEDGAQVVTFDDSGELAALQWFLTSEIAGLENMRVLPDTAAAWAQRGGILFVGKK